MKKKDTSLMEAMHILSAFHWGFYYSYTVLENQLCRDVESCFSPLTKIIGCCNSRRRKNHGIPDQHMFSSYKLECSPLWALWLKHADHTHMSALLIIRQAESLLASVPALLYLQQQNLFPIYNSKSLVIFTIKNVYIALLYHTSLVWITRQAVCQYYF